MENGQHTSLRPQLSCEHSATLSLPQAGDCRLLGVTDDLQVCVEQVWGPDDMLAWYHLAPDGRLLAAAHETPDGAPPSLPLPAQLARPAPVGQAAALNFRGPRWRGLRGPERLHEMVQELPIMEKMALAAALFPDVAPPALPGLVESHVLAEAAAAPDLLLICRRLRLAHVLPQPRQDDDGLPYDYDTLLAHVVQLYEPAADRASYPAGGVNHLCGLLLHAPMDCMVHLGHLIVVDGGRDEQPAQVHIWRLHGAS